MTIRSNCFTFRAFLHEKQTYTPTHTYTHTLTHTHTHTHTNKHMRIAEPISKFSCELCKAWTKTKTFQSSSIDLCNALIQLIIIQVVHGRHKVRAEYQVVFDFFLSCRQDIMPQSVVTFIAGNLTHAPATVTPVIIYVIGGQGYGYNRGFGSDRVRIRNRLELGSGLR